MKKTDLVYIKTTNALAFVIDEYENGDVRTDTDGVRCESELELIEFSNQLDELPEDCFIPKSINEKLTEYFSLKRELYWAQHNIKKCQYNDWFYDMPQYEVDRDIAIESLTKLVGAYV